MSCLSLSIFTTFSLISAPIIRLSFPLMRFVLPILWPPHSMITRSHAKASKSGPDLKWNAIMSAISQAPTLGEPNALPVTCCVVMTVHVTLQCHFLKHARKHRNKEMYNPCADKQHCCFKKRFHYFLLPPNTLMANYFWYFSSSKASECFSCKCPADFVLWTMLLYALWRLCVWKWEFTRSQWQGRWGSAKTGQATSAELEFVGPNKV